MRREVENTMIEPGASIRAALQKLCDSAKGVLFLVAEGRLIGSLSDGDIRRFLLGGGDIDAPVSSAANMRPRFIFTIEREKAVSFMADNGVTAVPVVDDSMALVDVAFLRESVPLDGVSMRELRAEDLGLALEFFDQMAGDTRAMFNRNDVNRIRLINHLNRKCEDNEIHFAATVVDGAGNEKMVGYVFLWDINTLVPWLGVAVREEWKGHHLGRRLLEHVDAWAKPKGYGGIMLTSVPANIRAHSLYSRMGYSYCGTYVDSEFIYIKRYPRNGGDTAK